MKLPLLAALALAALVPGCVTYYSETDPTTGATTTFASTSNIGFTTDKIAESNSTTGGVPLLNGSYANDTLTEAHVPANTTVGLTVGRMQINGPIDNSTPLDTGLGWLWRTARTIATGKVFEAGIGAFKDMNIADTNAEAATANATTAAGTDAARIAADVERTRIITEATPAAP